MAFQGGAFQQDSFQRDVIVVFTGSLRFALRHPAIRVRAIARPVAHGITATLARPAVSAYTDTGLLRELPRARVAHFLEVSPLGLGRTLYFSDIQLKAGGRDYEDYVRGVSLGKGRATFRNDPFEDFSHLIEMSGEYPFEGAGCEVKEVMLGDSGGISKPETIFKGVIGAVSDIDGHKFECSLIAPLEYMDSAWRWPVVDTSSYPNAYEDLGKAQQIVYGQDVLIPALRTDWGARTTLKEEITDASASIEVSDPSRLPEAGAVWIDEEKISYTSKTGNSLGGLTRGAGGTSAKPHRAGAEVWEHKEAYESVLACHELSSVGEIFAEIGNKLLRVDSGVSAVFEGGRHKLIATSQIKTHAVKDTISVTNPKHKHDADNTSVVHQAVEGFRWAGQPRRQGGCFSMRLLSRHTRA